MRSASVAIICIVVLCITLALGLWPFHAPRNDVAWLAGQEGLHFGKFSTVLSSRPFPNISPNGARDSSIGVWLQPGRVWDSNTFLAFYSPGKPAQFSLHQSLVDLQLQTVNNDDQSRSNVIKLDIPEVFRQPRPVFITITSGRRGTVVYLDGVPVKQTSEFQLSASAFMGRLVLGDSPRQTDSWSGQWLGLALYHRELTESQVFHNYVTWTQKGRPELTESESNIALYLFDEHMGNVIRDKAGSGVDLYIPATYTVMDQIFLEPFWSEFGMTRSYWSAVAKNIVGFVPFGFCFYAYLATILSIKRPTLVTVALGTVVSLTIEVLQAYLPTRDSGTTDLITNTLGTWIGAASYNWLAPAMVRIFPWLPFPAPASPLMPRKSRTLP